MGAVLDYVVLMFGLFHYLGCLALRWHILGLFCERKKGHSLSWSNN